MWDKIALSHGLQFSIHHVNVLMMLGIQVAGDLAAGMATLR
jgi:hypothetical protein